MIYLLGILSWDKPRIHPSAVDVHQPVSPSKKKNKNHLSILIMSPIQLLPPTMMVSYYHLNPFGPTSKLPLNTGKKIWLTTQYLLDKIFGLPSSIAHHHHPDLDEGKICSWKHVETCWNPSQNDMYDMSSIKLWTFQLMFSQNSSIKVHPTSKTSPTPPQWQHWASARTDITLCRRSLMLCSSGRTGRAANSRSLGWGPLGMGWVEVAVCGGDQGEKRLN